MVNSPTPDRTPRRAHSRLRLGISAHLETVVGRRKVRLIDLSQGGARMVVSELGDLRQGVLRWLDFDAFGSVVWREDSHLGFAFDSPLPFETLIETRHRAPSVVREEALLAQQAAREWVTGQPASDTSRVLRRWT